MDMTRYAKNEEFKRTLLEILEKIGVDMSSFTENDVEMLSTYGEAIRRHAEILPAHRRIEYLITVATANAAKFLIVDNQKVT